MSQISECVTGLEVDHNLTICLLIRRKNVLKPFGVEVCSVFCSLNQLQEIKIIFGR